MTILDTIIVNKRKEIKLSKKSISIEMLIESALFERKCNSLKLALLKDKTSGIIAEFKRRSPSKGAINANADVSLVTKGYADFKASGISVLTDLNFFGGTKEDLILARNVNPQTAILRKDFMVDTYQLYEAKAWGADVILLIASCLEANEIKELSRVAHELGLEVLLEVHDEKELAKSPLQNVDIIGVNNRNLKNFNERNVEASLRLIDSIPNEMVKISESCISESKTINELKKVGYQGFLVGEGFMKTSNPPAALASFIASID